MNKAISKVIQTISVLSEEEVAKMVSTLGYAQPKRDSSPTYKATSQVAIDYQNSHQDDAITGYELLTGNRVVDGRKDTHPKFAWMSSTADGLVSNNGLVSIRCPIELVGGEEIPLEMVEFCEGSVEWNKLQCQMEVFDREWCDVVVWGPDDFTVRRYYKDEQWKLLVEKAYMLGVQMMCVGSINQNVASYAS